MEYRTEYDSLGGLRVPKNAVWGIFTQRAKANFTISGIPCPRELIRAVGIIKKACAFSNARLGLLEEDLAKAMSQVANNIIEGSLDEHFPIDIFQAGAGTPLNMNANEVIANLANKMLGKEFGSYHPIHPNNHVNMSQSSNDVIPTAIRIAAVLALDNLEIHMKETSRELERLAKKSASIVKVGRTHLEDAVPLTFGQVFVSWRTAIQKSWSRIQSARESLLELGIGGTAIGTGINTHPEFRMMVVQAINKETGKKFFCTKDMIETTWSASVFVEAQSALKNYAIELGKITNDLRLLNSGPHAGIAELILPDVEPGSSIMPGKVNPSICECANMVCYQVIGNATTIDLASQNGQLELNCMTPVIAYDLLWSIELLTSTTTMMNKFVLSGLSINEKRCRELVEKSLSLATALNPYVGYEVAAQIVKQALASNLSIIDYIKRNEIIAEKNLGSILDPASMTRPGVVDKKLREKILAEPRLQAFRKNYCHA